MLVPPHRRIGHRTSETMEIVDAAPFTTHAVSRRGPAIVWPAHTHLTQHHGGAATAPSLQRWTVRAYCSEGRCGDAPKRPLLKTTAASRLPLERLPTAPCRSHQTIAGCPYQEQGWPYRSNHFLATVAEGAVTAKTRDEPLYFTVSSLPIRWNLRYAPEWEIR